MLALPLLPSLLPSEVFAQTVQANRRMMLFLFDHGNLTTLWPQRSFATQNVGSHGARQIPLRTVARSAISPILSNNRYEAIKNNDQLTILRGFDTAVAYGSAHGNFGLACAAERNSEGNHPTLDTVVERSTTVYPSSTPSSVRKALRINLLGVSFFYDKVGDRVQLLPNYNSNIRTFYNEVFSSLTNGTTPAPVDNTNQVKSNILNKVYESFSSFKNNRRISADDRARLDQHMGFISDLQSSFAAAVPPTPPSPSCNRPNDPGDIQNNPLAYNRLYMELLAIAFKCGLTKFSSMVVDASLWPSWIPGLTIPSNTDFHNVVHGSNGGPLQEQLFGAWWTYYAGMIADHFLANLQDIEGNTGRSYMENMITGMICAGGLHTLGHDGGHAGLDSQQILIGNMGGALRSGNYVSLPTSGGRNLPYNCFLITLLQLMGVPPSEYAYATADGRGFGFYGFGNNHPFSSRFYQPVTEVMA